MTSRTLTAAQLAALLGDTPLRRPAHRDLAARLRLLVLDGRLVEGVRLPSERALASRLALSRSTVAASYAGLRDSGLLAARPGSGNFVQRSAGDRVTSPREVAGSIVLTYSAAAASPGVVAAYEQALQDLPGLVGGHGYRPDGLPILRERLADWFADRGLPTDPEQIVVTSGALPALNLLATVLLEPGDRVLVESPTYANAVEALRSQGARLVPVPMTPGGWDLDALSTATRQTSPRFAYLIPDFQNPTGLLMDRVVRSGLGDRLLRERCVPIIDETLVEMNLDGVDPPPPFAAGQPDAVTIGSASKTFWGGLRTGWIRAPRSLVRRLVETRSRVDLGSAPVEQLVTAALIADRANIMPEHCARIAEQRDHLLHRLSTELPDWRVLRPSGGQTVWVELPAPVSSELVVAAAGHGLVITPGHRFFPAGGGERHLRLPFTASPATLTEAVGRLRRAWESIPEARRVADDVAPYDLIA